MVLIEELSRDDGLVYFRLYYNEAHDVYHAQWIGMLSHGELQYAAHKGLNHLHKHATSSFILDHTQSKTSWRDICIWVRVLWTPKSISSPLRYFAHWVNETDMAEVSRGYQDMVHGSVSQVFFSEEEALAWLSTVSHPKLTQVLV